MTSDSQLPHELVASLVLAAHAALPQSFQPAPTPTGPTWTPLAGVVLLPPPPPPTVAAAGTRPTLDAVVISIGTGSKVLPEARKSVHGDLVVDMHAETLAIRGARHWLADELVRCATVDGLAGWLEPATGEEASSPARWRLRAGVEVWLYASDIPCGEASTAYLARQQLLHDPTMAVLQASAADEPKPVELSVAAAAAAGPLRGRAAYPRARTLRTKPGRPDSPIAHSLSCSDKIARHGALGIQGALLADLLEPVWLSGVVLGPVSADEDREKLAAEASEALSGRVLRELEDERFRACLPAAFATPHIVKVHLSDSIFAHSRLALPTTPSPVPSPFCTLWISGLPKPEKLAAGGFRLGAAKRKGNAVLAPSGRSAVCKLAWATKVANIRAALGCDSLPSGSTYRALKASMTSSIEPRFVADDDMPLPEAGKKRSRLNASQDSLCLSAVTGSAACGGKGTVAYQLAKQAFRQPGALFDGWAAADAGWEAFPVPTPGSMPRR